MSSSSSSSSTSSSSSSTTSSSSSSSVNNSINFQTEEDFFKLPNCNPIQDFECKILPAGSLLYRYEQMGYGFANPKYPIWFTYLKLAQQKTILQASIINQFRVLKNQKLFNITNSNLIKLHYLESNKSITEKNFIRSTIEIDKWPIERVQQQFSNFPEIIASIKAQVNEPTILAIGQTNSEYKCKPNEYIIAYLVELPQPYNTKLYKNQQLANVIGSYGFDGWIAQPDAVAEFLNNKNGIYASEIMIIHPEDTIEARIYRMANVQRMTNLGAKPPEYSIPFMKNLRRQKGSHLQKINKVPLGVISNAVGIPIKQEYRHLESSPHLELLRIAIRKEYQRSGKVYPEYFGIYYPTNATYAELIPYYKHIQSIIEDTVGKQPPRKPTNTYNEVNEAPFTKIKEFTIGTSMLNNPMAYLQSLKSSEISNINTRYNTTSSKPGIFSQINTSVKVPSNLNLPYSGITVGPTRNVRNKRNKEIPIFSLKRNRKTKETPVINTTNMNFSSRPGILSQVNTSVKVPSNLNLPYSGITVGPTRNVRNKRNKEIPIFSLKRNRKTRRHRI